MIAPEDIEFKEKDIQRAFESDLSKLEEGLELVDTEVTIGTGRIDTLAFDTLNSRPVFIEYKRRGEFGKDALIQLMDYLSWFSRDENRAAVLERLIKKRKPDVEDFEPFIRLILVVTDIDDRVRNAIYALANHVKVFSYIVARDTAGNVILVPKLEADNSEVEQRLTHAVSEEEILKKHPHLKEIFNELRSHLEKDGAQSYTTARAFRFKKERVFANLRFRKRYIMLELRIGRGAVSDPDFKYWRQGEHDWGYTHVMPGKALPPKVIEWIDKARNFSSESGESDDTGEA